MPHTLYLYNVLLYLYIGVFLLRVRKVDENDLDKNILIETKRKNLNYKKGLFFVVNQEKVQEILKNKKYKGESLRLLLFFMSIVEYDNRIKSYTQIQIAEKTAMKQPQISRAMKELESDGLIYKDGRDYYFNEDFLTKGSWRYENK